MPAKGEKPGKGIYVCLDCGAEQVLQSGREPLKECRCGGVDFKEKEPQTTGKCKK
ncbi:MAG: hypothetical protein M0Z59_06695 [Nitrospiraceae bacterium]|nr:hypothetical protein [Nitrospiraceae bacterium]